MSGRDWQAFDSELRTHVTELAIDLFGQPSAKSSQEWRWGRKGSLSVIVTGDRAGMWFDHEAGQGGGFVDLVGRNLGIARSDANDWIADRIGMGQRHRPGPRRTSTPPRTANAPILPLPRPDADDARQARQEDADPVVARTQEAAARAARIWALASPAPADHSYLLAKQVRPLCLRMDARSQLVIPLQDVAGQIHSVEFIATDGTKRYLAGGAKKGHFVVVGAEPGPLPEPAGPVLICEGWATGASLHIATGHMVIAAMDAGNLLPVAQALRTRLPDADIVVVADNDRKPDRDTNPGVEAALKAALAIDSCVAVPLAPGDANDLFCAEGPEAVVALVTRAAKIPPPPPTYPAPVLTPPSTRSRSSARSNRAAAR